MPLFWDTMLTSCSPNASKWANFLKGCSHILLLLIFISCLSLQFELWKLTDQTLNKEHAVSPGTAWQILFPPGILPLAAKIIFSMYKILYMPQHLRCLALTEFAPSSSFMVQAWSSIIWIKHRYQEIENRLEAFRGYTTLV